jgi:hypothetical protein
MILFGRHCRTTETDGIEILFLSCLGLDLELKLKIVTSDESSSTVTAASDPSKR